MEYTTLISQVLISRTLTQINLKSQINHAVAFFEYTLIEVTH